MRYIFFFEKKIIQKTLLHKINVLLKKMADKFMLFGLN